jgi:hypothetical protein
MHTLERPKPVEFFDPAVFQVLQIGNHPILRHFLLKKGPARSGFFIQIPFHRRHGRVAKGQVPAVVIVEGHAGLRSGQGEKDRPQR